MKNLPGIQDVFCGPQTIVHLAAGHLSAGHLSAGSEPLAPGAIEALLAEFEIACEGIERDDSAVL